MSSQALQRYRQAQIMQQTLGEVPGMDALATLATCDLLKRPLPMLEAHLVGEAGSTPTSGTTHIGCSRYNACRTRAQVVDLPIATDHRQRKPGYSGHGAGDPSSRGGLT